MRKELSVGGIDLQALGASCKKLNFPAYSKNLTYTLKNGPERPIFQFERSEITEKQLKKAVFRYPIRL
jgi:hypothetical protein